MSAHRVVAWFEKVLNPIFMKIGWRSDLAAEDVLGDPTNGASLQVEYRFKIGLIDLWQIIVLTPKRPSVNERSTEVSATKQETISTTIGAAHLAVADAG